MRADRKRAVRNDRLRRARIERNLTQAEVAEQVGASELSVSRWELGTQAPLPYYREKLCRLYDMSAAELGLLADAEPEPAELPTPPAASEERARRDLLAQVRRYWIDTELEAATGALPRLAPGLAERPGAVDDPVRVRPRPPAAAAGRALPPGAAIGDVCRRLGQQLLVLGAPGAGKTTLLLRLASELLGALDGPLPEPMPVVFHLGVYWPVAAPNDIAVAVLLGASVAGLQRGGGAYLRHRVLLWLLAVDGHAPRDYPAFLEHAARLILLQRRGGGYEFVHRVLLDELADADADGWLTGTRRAGTATGVGDTPAASR